MIFFIPWLWVLVENSDHETVPQIWRTQLSFAPLSNPEGNNVTINNNDNKQPSNHLYKSRTYVNQAKLLWLSQHGMKDLRILWVAPVNHLYSYASPTPTDLVGKRLCESEEKKFIELLTLRINLEWWNFLPWQLFHLKISSENGNQARVG